MTFVVRSCSSCGARFEAYPTKGRRRSRCEACRSNHARLDGVAWRKLRAEVLAEEPVCPVAGCGRPSTQVDHIVALQLRPDLGLVRSNLRGICATHNASKGAGPGDVLPAGPRLCPCGCGGPRRWTYRDADGTWRHL